MTTRSDETLRAVDEQDTLPMRQVVVRRRMSLQPAVETAFIVCGLLAQLVLLPHVIWGDANQRFREIDQLVRHGTLVWTKYSIVGPLFSLPLYFLGWLYRDSVWWVARFNLFVLACGILALYFLLRKRTDPGLLRKFFLILVVASMFPAHIEAYYGECFTAVCVGAGLLAVVFGSPKARAAGWVAIVLGVVNTPATLLGLGCVALKQALDARRLRYFVAVVVAAALILAESWIRRGSPFTTGYETTDPGFVYPLFFGVLSILLSFGKGIIFFTPGMFLPIKSRLLSWREGMGERWYTAHALWIACVIGLVLAYASWWAWSGAWFWGPRFFLIASFPASLALAVRLHRPGSSLQANLMTLAALALSTWVGIQGAVFGQTDIIGVCQTHISVTTVPCYFIPEESALWHPFVVASQVGWRWNAFWQAEQLGPNVVWKLVLYSAFSALVFIYLAMPVLGEIWRQIRVNTFVRTRLNLANWQI